MKKNIFLSLLFVTSLFMMTGCIDNKKIMEDPTKNNNNNITSEGENDSIMENITSISMIINDKNYNVRLENNETAQNFVKLLPKEFNMSELNGNEKYIYMDTSLPINSSNPKYIVAGDIMLYGNDCLVIFYKSFNTSYSYTKIGHIDALPDLGNGNIMVKFEK